MATAYPIKDITDVDEVESVFNTIGATSSDQVVVLQKGSRAVVVKLS